MSFQADKDVMVAMRDGTELATDVWRPSGVSEDSESDAQTAVNRVIHGPEQPSRLVLPVIRR